MTTATSAYSTDRTPIYLRDSAEDASARVGSEGHRSSLGGFGVVARVLVELALRRLRIVRVARTVAEEALGLGAFCAALSLSHVCGVLGGLPDAMKSSVVRGCSGHEGTCLARSSLGCPRW